MSGEKNILNEEQSEFIRLIKERIFNKLHYFETGLLIELMEPNPNYDKIFQTFSSQFKDNREIMVSIIGEEAAQLIARLPCPDNAPKINSYWQGRDCGLNGPNPDNCNYSLFATPESLQAWELGKKHGEVERAKLK